MQKDKNIISLTKGVTWRIVGTIDTIFLSYIFTGSIGNSLKIGITEVFTKIFLFYLHERVWFRINWGIVKDKIQQNTSLQEVREETKLRSAIKGISWRIIGTLDTIILATLWTGDYSKALKIGFTEVITKVILFYFHERIWMNYTQKKIVAEH
jgi:uncharacterized membrane protein